MSTDPYDTRDAEERAEVAAFLNELPAAHPACDAYGRRAGTIELTHLVADRLDLVERLKQVYLPGFGRVLARSGCFRP